MQIYYPQLRMPKWPEIGRHVSIKDRVGIEVKNNGFQQLMVCFLQSTLSKLLSQRRLTCKIYQQPKLQNCAKTSIALSARCCKRRKRKTTGLSHCSTSNPRIRSLRSSLLLLNCMETSICNHFVKILKNRSRKQLNQSPEVLLPKSDFLLCFTIPNPCYSWSRQLDLRKPTVNFIFRQRRSLKHQPLSGKIQR